ncbi:hypothetical protein [Neosynechococcus sphagnicola]|uniref:hypothetical protein n=1 Tax=Neosynechococcus sphagnicola TaxID=1501145 RepID=UPI00068B336C|nr:hypothetical protein [Neosynechococcus sphagnicola]
MATQITQGELPRIEAQQALQKGAYRTAIALYQSLIALEPHIQQHYWYLGLGQLLQGQPEAARTTWQGLLATAPPDQRGDWETALIQILQQEAQRRSQGQDYAGAWLLWEQIQDLHPPLESPTDATILTQQLQTLRDTDQLAIVTGVSPLLGQVLCQLASEPRPQVNPELLHQSLQRLLTDALLCPTTLKFAAACLPYITSPQPWVNRLLIAARQSSLAWGTSDLAVQLAGFCNQLQPDDPATLQSLSEFYYRGGRFAESMATTRELISLATHTPEKTLFSLSVAPLYAHV